MLLDWCFFFPKNEVHCCYLMVYVGLFLVVVTCYLMEVITEVVCNSYIYIICLRYSGVQNKLLFFIIVGYSYNSSSAIAHLLLATHPANVELY